MLTAERLREVMNYDPDTGTFRWLKNTGRRKRAGKVAGTVNGIGYVVIRIDAHLYTAHRLAFLWMDGRWPVNATDHKNRNRSDNRWSNLREATASQNMANQNLRSDNKSGIGGVSFDHARNSWRAICAGKQLGRFPSKEEAVKAYQQAAKDTFGEYARSH